MSWSGFKKNVGRATTQVMMKTGHVEKTSDREYEVEERRYRTLESASLRLQKEAKGYLDSLRAMTASQMRIAETIDAFYGDSGAKDGVSRSYKQAVEDLDAETVKALDGPYRCVIQEYPALRKEVEKRFPNEEWDFLDNHLREVDAELNRESKEKTFSRNTAYYESQSHDKGTVELIDVIYRTTVLEPINRFCAYFPDINECIKKRNHKMLDYDAMRSKVKKLTEKPDKDPAKLPRTEKETEMVGDPYSFLDLPTNHLNHFDDDESSMLHSPPKALDGVHQHRLRLAKLEVDEKIALESVGVPTSPKVKRKSSLLRRISGVSDAFWGRTEAQKRVTVAGELSHAPLSPIAVSRHLSSTSQRSPLTDLPDIDESSTNFLSPVSSPIMMGGGLIPAISPHSTHAPALKRSSEPVRTRSTSGNSFSLLNRSPKETPTRDISMPVQPTSESLADGLGISGCTSPPDYTPTRLSSMPSPLMSKFGSSGKSEHPLFKRSPDGTPTRSSVMPGLMKKSSPLSLGTPTHSPNTPARTKSLQPDATPSRAAPPRFTVTSAASSELDAKTIRSSGASWQTTYSEASERERKDSMDPYTKNSDAETLATLTSSSYNEQDFYTVHERSSMDTSAQTDGSEPIADTDDGDLFDGYEHDERFSKTNDGDSTLVDFASVGESDQVASSNKARNNSAASGSEHSHDHSSALDIDAVIEAIGTPTPHKRNSIMEPRVATSNERRDHASFINFLKDGPPATATKPVRNFKPPPPVLPPLFGRPYSAASARPEPLFSPRTQVRHKTEPQIASQRPSTGPFFHPSELEDIMQPLKEEFAKKQADLLKQAKVAYDQLNEQLTNELPQLIDLRVPYLDPSFEALVKIQLRFCAEAYSRMAQVQQYLAAETRDQYASGDLDARVEDVLGQIRELSIAGTV